MPIYEYQAYEKGGKATQGMVDAPSEIEAKEKLRDQGLMVKKLGAPSRKRSKHGLTGDHLVNFTLQLHQLLNAGLPLYEALRSIEEQYRGEKFHRIILSLCEQVKSGTPLSQAMSSYPESFNRLYCSMVAAGEASGSLDRILSRLGDFLQRQIKLKKQIVTALIYPGILAAFAILVITLLIGFVIPSIEGIFEGRQLNGFTLFVLSTSHFFQEYWLYLIPLTALGVGLTVWQLGTERGRLWKERVGLRLPLVRNLMIQASLARFARTMATLQKGGLTLIDALRLSRGVMQNHSLEIVLKQAEERVVEGKSLSQQLSRSPLIPPLVWRMLKVGEEAGSTEGIWNRIADIYEGELEKTLGRIMSLAQPVILMIMGVVIGSVLLAVLLPLTDISSLAQ